MKIEFSEKEKIYWKNLWLRTSIRNVVRNKMFILSLYVLVGFSVWGYNMNHWCDEVSSTPKFINGNMTEKQYCQEIDGFRYIGPIVSGALWPIYCTGKFFIWFWK